MVTIRMPLLCQALAKEFSDQLLSCVSDGRIHTLPLKTSYEKFERVRSKWHAAHVLVPNEAVDFASLADKAAAELEPVLLPCDPLPFDCCHVSLRAHILATHGRRTTRQPRPAEFAAAAGSGAVTIRRTSQFSVRCL
jgi:hypothetical protein